MLSPATKALWFIETHFHEALTLLGVAAVVGVAGGLHCDGGGVGDDGGRGVKACGGNVTAAGDTPRDGGIGVVRNRSTELLGCALKDIGRGCRHGNRDGLRTPAVGSGTSVHLDGGRGIVRHPTRPRQRHTQVGENLQAGRNRANNLRAPRRHILCRNSQATGLQDHVRCEIGPANTHREGPRGEFAGVVRREVGFGADDRKGRGAGDAHRHRADFKRIGIGMVAGALY